MNNNQDLESFPTKYLKKMNIVAGSLHLVTGVLMVILGTLLEWSQPLYTFYLKFDTSTIPFRVVPYPQVAITLTNLGLWVASFPLMSALAHFLVAYPLFDKYVGNLKKGMNPYRWYEYTFSSSVMIFLIATFVGVWDVWSLVMIFVLNAVTMLLGYLMELLNQYTEKTNWSPFIIGCIAGFTPWIVLFAYFYGAVTSTGVNPPAFVYAIFFIYFAVFNVFALNMYLQYKKIGPWKNYLYGERMYIILSLTAKTILAWLVFIGVFAPF